MVHVVWALLKATVHCRYLTALKEKQCSSRIGRKHWHTPPIYLHASLWDLSPRSRCYVCEICEMPTVGLSDFDYHSERSRQVRCLFEALEWWPSCLCPSSPGQCLIDSEDQGHGHVWHRRGREGVGDRAQRICRHGNFFHHVSLLFSSQSVQMFFCVSSVLS